MLLLGRIFIITLVAGCLAAAPAKARPTTYSGGWMFMQMNDPFMNTGMVIYSPTARLGLGPVFEHWRDRDVNFAGMQINILAQRWNNPDSQGNLYVLTSAGRVHAQNAAGAAGNIGIEADWEDRRYYVSFENRLTLAENVTREYTQKARVGIAPYIAEYGALHLWLMLQADHRPEDQDSFTVTPLVRVFKGDFLGEAGISDKGVLLNATFNF